MPVELSFSPGGANRGEWAAFPFLFILFPYCVFVLLDVVFVAVVVPCS